MDQIRCKYVGQNNVSCHHPAGEHSGFCFWHDMNAAKNTPDIKARLEELVREGNSLEGFALHKAKLSGANLAHANLNGARLFQADLSGASLFKTNLDNANLNEANLENANLLGVRLENARLEHTYWGKYLLQEVLARNAHKAGKKIEAKQLYGEAEEVARYITNESEKRRQYDVGGRFYRLERVMRRMQMRPLSSEWLWSKLVDMLCGYGENAARVMSFSILIILISAMCYFLIGLHGAHGLVAFDNQLSSSSNAIRFLECLYFSVITFTTTGYGDFSPAGFSRLVAVIEAFIGAFSISLFVVVFVRNMTQ